jgi:Skp family chaperone for outer membrane proteins
MKIKMLVLGCLACAVILVFGHDYTSAQSNDSTLKIGIVSIEKVLRDCKETAHYRELMSAENDKILAEQDKLSKEIQALRAGLQLGTLKVGSSDYLSQHWELAQKEAELQARKDFDPQQQALKQQMWTQELYKKILKITTALAEEKKLALVLEKSEPEFPIQRDLGMIMGTYKVLYSGGCLNLTDEVIARLDAEASKPETQNPQ